jgi:hypothetical protein
MAEGSVLPCLAPTAVTSDGRVGEGRQAGRTRSDDDAMPVGEAHCAASGTAPDDGSCVGLGVARGAGVMSGRVLPTETSPRGGTN